ncbi:MAG: histidinol-phosphatase HisJ family protein [Lachnospiraceae bacterium]|nr:histidinol-phosphatase HisJ family protein [Lachnospiraceae bacterium]
MSVLSDYHVHTTFSGDGETAADAMIRHAIELGLEHLCLTDHIDYDYRDGDVCFEFDPREYFHHLEQLRSKYREQIDLQIGVELGLRPYLAARNHSLVFSCPFDFVIGSVHLVNSRDPYYPSYFKNRDEFDAYMEYFECCLHNIEAYSNFDAFGHLDYVIRYGPNRDRYYSYDLFRGIIDEILRLLVRKDIALEVNTTGYRYGLGAPNPGRDILLRYRELGGKLITIGSDAHKADHLAWRFDDAAELIKSCGFSSYYTFHRRVPTEVPL